ncbi:MAG: hypothetical protein H6736_08595 [Alphaproteobacteria bacterium]|nr:hypothetical protein [Alphaproteobacteria bacterium]
MPVNPDGTEAAAIRRARPMPADTPAPGPGLRHRLDAVEATLHRKLPEPAGERPDDLEAELGDLRRELELRGEASRPGEDDVLVERVIDLERKARGT